MAEPNFGQFQDHARLSWDVFFDLQRIEPEIVGLELSEARRGEVAAADVEESEGTTVDAIQVTRDVDSLTVEELSLVVTLVRERFENELAINEEMPAEDASYQEEMIHRSLEKIRMGGSEGSLTGFRDDMRVLIYSSQEPR